MTLLEQIKKDSIEQRKLKSNIASYYITLVGECSRPGKDKGNRDSTDEEVISVLKKFKAGAIEMLGYAVQSFDAIKQEEIARELDVLKKYLPEMMSGVELEEHIRDIVAEGINQMGGIMKELKVRFAGKYDGKQANEIIKKVLS